MYDDLKSCLFLICYTQCSYCQKTKHQFESPDFSLAKFCFSWFFSRLVWSKFNQSGMAHQRCQIGWYPFSNNTSTPFLLLVNISLLFCWSSTISMSLFKRKQMCDIDHANRFCTEGQIFLVSNLFYWSVFRRHSSGFDIKWIVRFYTNPEIHVNKSKVLLGTPVVVSNIICNETGCIKLETNAK